MTINPDNIVLVTEVYLGGWARSYQTAKKHVDPNATFYFADDEDINPLTLHQTRKGMGKNTPGKRFKMFLVECDDDETAQPEPPAREYGSLAAILRISGFMRSPDVWDSLGTDAEFRDWVTYQPSVVSGDFSEYDETGVGRCVACHVRRAGNSGTGHKPDYACVPLTDAEHREQHQLGEAACLSRYSPKHQFVNAEDARSWFDRKRMETVIAWAWQRLRSELGAESLSTVPPEDVYAWAEAAGVEHYLPAEYRQAGSHDNE